MTKKILYTLFSVISLVFSIPFFYPIIPIIDWSGNCKSIISDLYQNIFLQEYSKYRATWTNIYYFDYEYDSKKELFLVKKIIPGANILNYKFLGQNDPLVTSDGVYYNGEKLDNFDYKTIKKINSHLFYDKDGIGNVKSKIIGLFLKDPKILKEDNFIYSDNNIDYKLVMDGGFNYIKDGKKIIGLEWNKHSYHVIPIDYSEDFRIFYEGPISSNYTKNNKNVFYYDKIIENADPESFEIILKTDNLYKYLKKENIKKYPKRFAKDKNNYYADGKIFTGEDLKIFLEKNR